MKHFVIMVDPAYLQTTVAVKPALKTHNAKQVRTNKCKGIFFSSHHIVSVSLNDLKIPETHLQICKTGLVSICGKFVSYPFKTFSTWSLR